MWLTLLINPFVFVLVKHGESLVIYACPCPSCALAGPSAAPVFLLSPWPDRLEQPRHETRVDDPGKASKFHIIGTMILGISPWFPYNNSFFGHPFWTEETLGNAGPGSLDTVTSLRWWKHIIGNDNDHNTYKKWWLGRWFMTLFYHGSPPLYLNLTCLNHLDSHVDWITITTCSFSPQLLPVQTPFAPVPCSGPKLLSILPPALEGLVPFRKEPDKDQPNDFASFLGGWPGTLLIWYGEWWLSAKNAEWMG